MRDKKILLLSVFLILMFNEVSFGTNIENLDTTLEARIIEELDKKKATLSALDAAKLQVDFELVLGSLMARYTGRGVNKDLAAQMAYESFQGRSFKEMSASAQRILKKNPDGAKLYYMRINQILNSPDSTRILCR